jgi:hypothetical protein
VRHQDVQDRRLTPGSCRSDQSRGSSPRRLHTKRVGRSVARRRETDGRHRAADSVLGG